MKDAHNSLLKGAKIELKEYDINKLEYDIVANIEPLYRNNVFNYIVLENN